MRQRNDKVYFKSDLQGTQITSGTIEDIIIRDNGVQYYVRINEHLNCLKKDNECFGSEETLKKYIKSYNQMLKAETRENLQNKGIVPFILEILKENLCTDDGRIVFATIQEYIKENSNTDE